MPAIAAAVRLHVRFRSAFVVDAEAAADVEVFDRQPRAPEVAGEVCEGRRGLLKRRDVDDLRADVGVQADKFESRPPRLRPAQGRRLVQGHAELASLEAGRDVRMRARIDVRVHPQGHARAGALGTGDRRDAAELTRRFRVDGLQAEGHGAFQFLRRLAHAGEDDLLRDEPGAQGHLDLASRVGVGTGPEAPDQAGHRQGGVGLQGVMNRVGHVRARPPRGRRTASGRPRHRRHRTGCRPVGPRRQGARRGRRAHSGRQWNGREYPSREADCTPNSGGQAV